MKVRGCRNMLHEWKSKESLGAIFISDKIDWTSKTVARDQEVDWLEEYNNCKYTCTWHWSTEIHKKKINRSKGRNWQQYNNIRVLQYSTFNNGYIIQILNYQGNSTFQLYLRQNGSNRHRQHSIQQQDKYTFHSSIHGIVLSINHVLCQNHLNKFNNIEIILNISAIDNSIKLEINNRRKTRNLQICGNLQIK